MQKIKLETKRLILREVHLKDAAFIYQLMNSPKWIQFIGDRGINNLKDASNYIEKSLISSYSTNGYGLYIMIPKGTKTKIGLCGLINRPGLNHPDIGFALMPEFERQGYTFEAAKATLKFAKEKLVLPIVLAIVSINNIASQNLLKKLGLAREKRITSKGFDNDIILYSIHFKEND